MKREFKPGFRFSAFDALILAGGAAASALAWQENPQLGCVIAFVLGHFFLFCNVFRISRGLELIWAAVFVALTIGTQRWGWPGWFWEIAATLAMTSVVIALEMRKASYHGIGWVYLNPRLSDWWQANELAATIAQNGHADGSKRES